MKPPRNSPRNSTEWMAYRAWFAEQPDDGWRDLALSAHGVRTLESLVDKLALPADVFAMAGSARWVEGVGLPVIPETRDEIVIRVKLEDHERKVEALTKTLAGQPGGYDSLRQAYRDCTGSNALPVTDFVAAMVGRDGGYDSGIPTEERMRESVTSGTFPSLLGDSIARRIVDEFNVSPGLQAWRSLVSSQSFSVDYRSQKLEHLGGYGLLPTVAQGATYNALPTPAVDEATYSIAKRGGTEDLTLEAFANDDIGAVKRIVTSMGRAAANTLNRAVLDILVANGLLTFDSTALFAAGHANTTATALSAVALDASRIKMRRQARLSDATDVVGAVPRYLIVPPELEALALSLQPLFNAASVSDRSDLQQPVDVVCATHFASTTGWFLVCDPRSCPTIEVGFSGPTAEPAVTIQGPDGEHGAAYTADKVTIRLRHVFGLGVAEYRGMQRGNT